MTERAERIAWCKSRALAYVDAGDLPSAVASMSSDLGAYDETRDLVQNPFLMAAGLSAAMAGAAETRHWIEGF